jgi:hypothetical protein
VRLGKGLLYVHTEALSRTALSQSLLLAAYLMPASSTSGRELARSDWLS